MDGAIPGVDLAGKDEASRALLAQRTGSYLVQDDITEADRRAAELIARVLIEDAVERVRCELSKAIRHARHLPRDLALKLAHDVDSVACPFLEITEVFSDSDWQQLILTISRNARVAVARRSSMTESLAILLSELGDAVVAETLVENQSTPATDPVCHTLLDRFASETWVLDKLALRDDLTSNIAMKLTLHVSAAARDKLARTYSVNDFVEAVAGEAESAAILRTAGNQSAEDLIDAVEALHAEGKLRPCLILQALQERQVGFVEASFSIVAQRSLQHVRSVIHRANHDAAQQLFERANIPQAMYTDFWDEILRGRKK